MRVVEVAGIEPRLVNSSFRGERTQLEGCKVLESTAVFAHGRALTCNDHNIFHTKIIAARLTNSGMLDFPAMKDFLSELQDRVLVCDGAMGTMLYSKGIFISRCFDELNVSNPDLVREVHLDYIKAGVDIIETNTFGGNRMKLMSHGLADQIRDINVRGAAIARDAAGTDVFVGGAIGPLGIRIEPWGKHPSMKRGRYFENKRKRCWLEVSIFSFWRRFPI